MSFVALTERRKKRREPLYPNTKTHFRIKGFLGEWL